MATSVGMLTIEMAANIARLQKDMDSAKRSVDGAMAQIKKSAEMATKALGAIGVGLSITGIANMVKNAINLGDAMSDISQRTGVAVKDIAGLQMAFKYGGASAGAFESAMSRLSVGIVNGNKALEAMGVQAKNADGSMKSTRQVLGEVADRFASYEDGAKKTALAIEIFGKSGAELLPVLNGGADGLAEFDAMAQKLGLTLDKKTVGAMGEFNDTIDLIKDAFTGMFTQIAVQILPSLQAMAEAFFTLVSEGEMLKIVSKAIVTVFQTVAVVGSDVLFVLRQIGLGFIALKDAAAEALTGNLSGARKVFEDYNAQAEEARAALDKFQATVMGTGETTVGAMAKATNAMKKAAVSAKELEEAQKKAAEEMAAAAKRNNEEFDKYFDSIEKVRLAQENGIKKAREMVENIEFEAEALQMTNKEREVAIALRQLELNGLEKGSAAYEEMAKRIREALGSKQAVQEGIEAQKKIADEWKRTTEVIEQSLTDALMRGFEDGKGFVENFKQTLINMFKTMVLRPIIQPIVQGTLGAIGLSVAGPAGAAEVGGTVNMISGIKTAYDMISTGFAKVGATVSESLLRAGDYLATSSNNFLASGGEFLQSISQGAGTVAAGIAGFAAGMALNKMISGGYKVSNTADTVQTIANAAATLIFGPIGGVVAGAISGVFNRAFGRKLADQGLQGTFSAGGFEGSMFRFEKGGWFRSDKTSYSPADPELVQGLGTQFQAIQAATFLMAASLGEVSENVLNFTKDIKISFMGLTEEQIQERIAEEFENIANEIAALIPGLQQFQKSGENISETLSRLYNAASTVNQVFDTLGYTIFATSLATADMADQLIGLFGGADEFIRQTSQYYQDFYTEAERTATTTRQLTAVLEGMGYQLPATRDAFRALVEAQDLTTESGRQTYAALMSLAPAFASISLTIEESAEALRERASLEQRLLQLQGDVAELRRRELLAVDESNRSILERIYALEDEQAAYEAAQRATDAAFDAVQRAITAAAQAAEKSITAAYEALRQSLETQLESARAARDVADESLNSLRSIFDMLKEQIADLRGEASAGMTPGQGLAFIDQAIATARATGYMPEQGSLSEAIAAARSGLRAENYATSFELRRDRLMLAGKLGDLQTLVGEQMTVAERQLAVAEEQLASLESRIEQARVQYEEELARNQAYYDQMLLNAQTQINELRGINQSVMGVSAAMSGLASAISAEMAARTAAQAAAAAASQAAAQKAPAAFSQSGYRLVGNTLYFPGGGSHTVSGPNGAQLLTETYGLQQTPSGLIRTRAMGGYTPPGLTLVGEEGPELVDFERPGMVYTASQSASIMGGEAVSEIKKLREENKAQARALVQLQARMTRLLERWDGDGLPEERAVA